MHVPGQPLTLANGRSAVHLCGTGDSRRHAGYRYDRLMAPAGPAMTNGEKLTGYAPGFGRLLLRTPTISPVWGSKYVACGQTFKGFVSGKFRREISFTTQRPQ